MSKRVTFVRRLKKGHELIQGGGEEGVIAFTIPLLMMEDLQQYKVPSQQLTALFVRLLTATPAFRELSFLVQVLIEDP